MLHYLRVIKIRLLHVLINIIIAILLIDVIYYISRIAVHIDIYSTCILAEFKLYRIGLERRLDMSALHYVELKLRSILLSLNDRMKFFYVSK